MHNLVKNSTCHDNNVAKGNRKIFLNGIQHYTLDSLNSTSKTDEVSRILTNYFSIEINRGSNVFGWKVTFIGMCK